MRDLPKGDWGTFWGEGNVQGGGDLDEHIYQNSLDCAISYVSISGKSGG